MGETNKKSVTPQNSCLSRVVFMQTIFS
jgi:hypothetical protein